MVFIEFETSERKKETHAHTQQNKIEKKKKNYVMAAKIMSIIAIEK